MKVYIDTSGFYAYICRNDRDHVKIRDVMHRLASERAGFITSSYALSETMGLVQKRLGFTVLSDFVRNVLPVVEIFWIGQKEHLAGWDLMQSRPRRGLTMVDAAGIIVMRQEGINACVALDPEFAREGFNVFP